MTNDYWLSEITRTHYDFANQSIEEQFQQYNLRSQPSLELRTYSPFVASFDQQTHRAIITDGNQVRRIKFTDGKVITYLYDAGGSKLKMNTAKAACVQLQKWNTNQG